MSVNAHHGMTPSDQLMANTADVGDTFFGRLLPANPITGLTRQDALDRISPIVHNLADINDPAGAVPAGYTFFGQFIDHDITMDVTSELGRVINPSLVRNVRTAALDLDCVYGFGPEASPHLYSTKDGQKGYLLYGTTQNNLDLARNCHSVALIGDPRNDENGIVSQVHGMFVRFANLVLHEVSSNAGLMRRVKSMPGSVELLSMTENPFDIARTLIRWHYQWLIINDFLPRFVDPDVLDWVVHAFRTHKLPKPFIPTSPIIPIEFAVAGYRFGHATIQNHYKMTPNGQVLDLFGKNGIPAFGAKPSSQNIDIELFFDVPGATNAFQVARPIGLTIAQQLFDLPFFGQGDVILPDLTIPSADNRSLAHRNIYRDRFTLLLPSGQQFANAMLRTPLMPNAQFQQAGIDKIPLWYYLLQESDEVHGGKLGWVGGTIVAGTLLRLLVLDEMSVWHQPSWQPIFGDDGDAYTLGHLAKWTRDSHNNIPFWPDLRCPN